MTDGQPVPLEPKGFWAEVRRRGVFRIAGVYVAAGFVVLQLGEIVLPAFNAPDWALQTLVVFVFLGLPVALALSWVFDLTPEGVKRTRTLVPAGQGSLVPRLALVLVTAVSVVLGAAWFSRSAMRGSDGAGPMEAGRSPPASLAAGGPDAPITAVAVLPLDHLAEGDDLFARQLHEEIITRLSILTSLRVVSRTSVERYRTTDRLLPEIAAELRVQAVVTGSVAMTGESDSVRISIQLLHAPSDTHLATLVRQREMKDILRLQTEIAVEIVEVVQGELEEGVVEDVERIAQVDPAALRAFLAGMQELERGTPEALVEALEDFDRAIEHDSGYARPLIWRAAVHLADVEPGDVVPEEIRVQVREDLGRAQTLGGAADEMAAAMIILGDRLGRGAAGEPAELETGVPDGTAGSAVAASAMSDSLRREYLAGATRIGRMFGRQSPMDAARRYSEAGLHDSAVVALRSFLDENPRMAPAWKALEDLYLQQGDYAGAVAVREDRIYATQGETPAARAAVRTLRARFDAQSPATYWEWRRTYNAARQARGERVSNVELAETALGLGDAEAALEHLGAAVDARDPALIALWTNPFWDPLRQDAEFREILERARERWRGPGGGEGRFRGREGERRPR